MKSQVELPLALPGPFEGERSGIDAVAQAGGTRSVGKDVAQMAAAVGAGNLDAAHAQVPVLVLGNDRRVGRQQKAGPAAAGVELGPAQKQQRPAARAVVVPCLVVLGQRAGEGPLGGLFAQNAVLLRREQCAPLRLTPHNLLW